jgi:hypothetical protein
MFVRNFCQQPHIHHTMKTVAIASMIPNKLYYIESCNKVGTYDKNARVNVGSGKQIGRFEYLDGDVVRFSEISDIVRPDGTTGRSGMSTSGDRGYRHKSHFRFYKPCIETLMMRAVLRRTVNSVREIGYNLDEFIE